MSKVLVTVVTLLALAGSYILAADDGQTCQSETLSWGGEDIREYYFCVDGVVYTLYCPEGHYFVSNSTVEGCIPELFMNPNCYNADIPTVECSGISLKQPQPSSVLTNFFLCTEEGADPVELTCLDDKVFVSQDGYLGCFDWPEWRQLRNCEQ